MRLHGDKKKARALCVSGPPNTHTPDVLLRVIAALFADHLFCLIASMNNGERVDGRARRNRRRIQQEEIEDLIDSDEEDVAMDVDDSGDEDDQEEDEEEEEEEEADNAAENANENNGIIEGGIAEVDEPGKKAAEADIVRTNIGYVWCHTIP